MKFEPKDQGVASENSSGGGTEGLLKELFYMLLAYWGMSVGVIALIFVLIFAVSSMLIFWLSMR